MDIRFRITRRRVATSVVVLALSAVGVGYTAIPSASGVISGCYDLKTGLVRVVDAEAGARCDAKKEGALDWNRTGPQGAQGATGPQGPAGTAEAFARIRWDGANVIVSNARGIAAANVKRAAQGIYCIEGLSFQPNVAIGSGVAAIRPTGTNADGSTAFATTGHDTIVTAQTTQEGTSFLVFCDDSLEPPNPTVRIYVADGAGNLVDRQFTILLDE
jgi:hypothetical protein